MKLIDRSPKTCYNQGRQMMIPKRSLALLLAFALILGTSGSFSAQVYDPPIVVEFEAIENSNVSEVIAPNNSENADIVDEDEPSGTENVDIAEQLGINLPEPASAVDFAATSNLEWKNNLYVADLHDYNIQCGDYYLLYVTYFPGISFDPDRPYDIMAGEARPVSFTPYWHTNPDAVLFSSDTGFVTNWDIPGFEGIQWKSSNESICQTQYFQLDIDEGKQNPTLIWLVGKGEGTAAVQLVLPDGIIVQHAFTIAARPPVYPRPMGFLVNPSIVRLTAGQTASAALTCLPEEGVDGKLVLADWVSSNPAVATLDNPIITTYTSLAEIPGGPLGLRVVGRSPGTAVISVYVAAYNAPYALVGLDIYSFEVIVTDGGGNDDEDDGPWVPAVVPIRPIPQPEPKPTPTFDPASVWSWITHPIQSINYLFSGCPGGLSVSSDRYSFINHDANFTRLSSYDLFGLIDWNQTIKNYYVSDGDYNKLVAYTRALFPYTADGYIDSIKAIRKRDWSGSCYAMATTAVLDKLGKLNIKAHFNKSALNQIPNPITDLDVLSAINYYQISWPVSYQWAGTRIHKYENPVTNWTTGVESIVRNARDGMLPMLFSYYWTENNGHSIIITGYSTGSNGSHDLLAYDVNDPTKDTKVNVSSDYNTVSSVFGSAMKIYSTASVAVLDGYDSINLFGAGNSSGSPALQSNTAASNTEMSSVISSIDTEDIARISFRPRGVVTITNAEGETLVYNSETYTYSGTMGILDYFDSAPGPNATTGVYVANSESFTITSSVPGTDTTVVSKERYASAESKIANTVVINNESVALTGTGNFDYTLHLSDRDNIGELIKLSGTTTGSVSLTLTADGVQAKGVGAGATLLVFGEVPSQDKEYAIPAGFNPVTIKGTPGNISVIPALDISKTSLTLDYKGNTTLKAGEAVKWKSSNAAVTVDETSGKVTSVKSFNKFSKTATITATSLDGERMSSCQVSVNLTWWQWLITILGFGWIWY